MKITILLKNTVLFLFLITLQSLVFADNKFIALTIDDLPFVGEYRNFHLNMIINTLKVHQVPATGFVIASEIRNNNWETLQQFRDAGFSLGNHTFSHANLNKIKAKEYMKEISQADKILSPVLTEPKYFRYPYLAMSSGRKKEKILDYLSKNNYRIAPVTIDTKDFYFNSRLLSIAQPGRRQYLNELKPFYLDFIWEQTLAAEAHNQYHHQPEKAQVLLLHSNLLNAYVLPDIINLYKKKGYIFISLEDALKTFKKSSKSAKPVHKDENDKQIEGFLAWD